MREWVGGCLERGQDSQTDFETVKSGHDGVMAVVKKVGYTREKDQKGWEKFVNDARRSCPLARSKECVCGNVDDGDARL